MVSSNDPFVRTLVEQTAKLWVLREMHPNGGYYASLDADSEHEEGKFTVWAAQRYPRAG